MPHTGKIFGLGLPRTATTSLAMAMLELGYRTAHVVYDNRIFDHGDCFLDSPVYNDYPLLDARYPGSRFILTWREPETWLASFKSNLLQYYRSLIGVELTPRERVRYLFLHWYSQAFGPPEHVTDESLLACYHAHRAQVERYFAHRPQDLLIMEMGGRTDHWGQLCAFLGHKRPETAFPLANQGRVQAWETLEHPLRVSSWAEGIPALGGAIIPPPVPQ